MFSNYLHVGSEQLEVEDGTTIAVRLMNYNRVHFITMGIPNEKLSSCDDGCYSVNKIDF